MSKLKELITYEEYCNTLNITKEEEEPSWFSSDQSTAIEILRENIAQIHIFPVNRNMYEYLKPQYKENLLEAISYQIKYVHDHQNIFDNPISYYHSVQVGTASRGPVQDIETLLHRLCPRARAALNDMGWLYCSLKKKYNLFLFYDKVAK